MADLRFAELDEDDDDEGEGQIATGDKRRFFTKELKFLVTLCWLNEHNLSKKVD